MNLKEAFQAQNKLNELFIHFSEYLENNANVMNVKEKHFRSKAVTGQIDEVLDVTDYMFKIYPTDKVIDFLIVLVDEREKLARAIHAAKSQMELDIDTAVDANKKRHKAIEVLREMRQLKSSSLLKKNFGMDFVFNNEGNQTNYRYDVEIVKTIDFDRNKVRAIVDRLQKKADEVSAEIDVALIQTEVDYVFPFDPHASAAETLEDFSQAN